MFADQLTVQAAAGANTTLKAQLGVVAFAALSALPALTYLLYFAQKSKSTAVDWAGAASPK